MPNELRTKAIVQPGGLVNLQSLDLPVGTTVELIVLVSPQSEPSLTPLVSFIGAAQGSFATPDEVDLFIRQERDEWAS